MKHVTRKLTEPQRHQVARLYREGVKLKDIAAQFDISLPNVLQLARNRGAPRRRRTYGKRGWDIAAARSRHVS